MGSQISTLLTSRNPMVIVIRLSAEADPETHPMAIMFTGILKAFILLMLTIFFGSVYGGTLFFTIILVVCFLLVIALSRTLSVWLFCWLEKSMELRVIECESSAEMRGMARLLAAMPGMLVESKTYGYRYSGGYRVGVEADECSAHAESVATYGSGRLIRSLICWGFAVLASFLTFGVTSLAIYPWRFRSDILTLSCLFTILSGGLIAIELSMRLCSQVLEYREGFVEGQETSNISSGDIELEEVSAEGGSCKRSKNVSIVDECTDTSSL